MFTCLHATYRYCYDYCCTLAAFPFHSVLLLSYVLVFGSEADESACVSFWHHAILTESESEPDAKPEWWYWVARTKSYRGGRSEGVAHIAAESARNPLAGGQRALE